MAPVGRYCWVVERTFAQLHNFKRLLIRYERRADMHNALLARLLPRLLSSTRELNLT